MPNTTTLRAPPLAAYPNCWHTGILLVAIAWLGFVGPAWAQNSAAKVMAVSGQAKAIDAQGRERILEKGAELFTGDRVQTLDTSLVQLRMHDGGYLSVRANSELVLDQFAFDEKDPGKSNFLLSLVRGGFRSITGLIGRSNPNGYQIRAATATIGIRGTDHEPVLVLDTPDAQLPGQPPPGLYDKVNDGETFITSRGVVLPLRRGDVGFAPLNTNLPPQVLLKIPDFYRVDLKTDARDPRDGGSTDGARSGGGALLRPSVAARREAQAAGGGSTGAGTAPTNSNTTPTTTAPAQNTQPTQPAQTTQATPTAAPTATAKPALTPEQKRAVVQGSTPTPTTTKTTAPTPTPTQR